MIDIFRRLCTKVLNLRFLCATSVVSVSLWCVFARNSSTTETQRTQRLHREERYNDFLCKASSGDASLDAHDLFFFTLRQFVNLGDVGVGVFLNFLEGIALGVFRDGLVLEHLL